MEKYGFVYIWFDSWRKMYYVGSHWGTEFDGYICSSKRMRDAYRRRPQDFKRRTLLRLTTSKQNLLDEEYRYLSMVKQEELGNKYYNLTNHKNGHWMTVDEKLKTVGEKISRAHRNNPNLGKWNIGKVRSEKQKNKISAELKGRKLGYERSDETRKLISENNKRLQKEKKIGMHGKNHRPETIEKMKANNAMNNPEHVAKVKASKQGIKWLTNGEVKKMAVPGTTKYVHLIDQGFNPL